MSLRSLLFVPGDSDHKIAKSESCPADAIILDLEDSVMPGRKVEARRITRVALDYRTGGRAYWVRINSHASGEALKDLVAVAGGRPDVILVPKADSAADLERIDHQLSALELREGLPEGGIKLAVLATETPASIGNIGSYRPSCPRLIGLSWGAEDLSVAIGATSNRNEAGQLTPLYTMARSMALVAAAAAGVDAIDTPSMGFRDLDALRAECEAARRDGFVAKMAIHPDQVPVINEAFTPSAAEVELAELVVAAFAAQPDVGAFQIDGRMVDLPHLEQARRLLARRAGREG